MVSELPMNTFFGSVIVPAYLFVRGDGLVAIAVPPLIKGAKIPLNYQAVYYITAPLRRARLMKSGLIPSMLLSAPR
jgi:hypothetical protein